MTFAALASTQDIVVEDVFAHSPALLWRTLTTPELMGRWLMTPEGFSPEVGTRFTYQTTPAGPWDGVIHCEVLEATPERRLSYSWCGGHEQNVGYGSRLETTVTWTLTPVNGGTRLQLVHAGFRPPENDTAYAKMSEGWRKVVAHVDVLSTELARALG